MTRIKNIKTNEITEITILDPKTGLDWSMDFIGENHDDDLTVSKDDDCDFIGDESAIDWWLQYAYEYQSANYRLHNAMKSNDSDDYYDLYNEYLSVDFNELASAMNQMAEYLENR